MPVRPLSDVRAIAATAVGLLLVSLVALASGGSPWHAGGRVGPRPPGRLRRLEPPRLGFVKRALATPAYLVLHDPDGRPRPLRKSDDF